MVSHVAGLCQAQRVAKLLQEDRDSIREFHVAWARRPPGGDPFAGASEDDVAVRGEELIEHGSSITSPARCCRPYRLAFASAAPVATRVVAHPRGEDLRLREFGPRYCLSAS